MTTACLQCRNRKVKCKRLSDSDAGCVNCQRLAFDCKIAGELDEVAAANDPSINRNLGRPAYTLAGTVRKRVSRACEACHSQKAKCSAELPSCKRCVSRGFKCRYTNSKRRVLGAVPLSPGSESSLSQSTNRSTGISPCTGESPASQAHPETTGEALSCSEESMRCDNATLKAHINAYFDFVYPMPGFSFLHRAYFMRDFNEGTCSAVLLRAVCAAGSVYLSRHPDDQKRKQIWIGEAESAVLRTSDVPSMVSIQTMLILIFFRAAMRSYRKVMTLLSIASRMAYMSRLNYERDGLPFMVQETRRRVMWALGIEDSFYAGGLPEFTVCAIANCHLKLPCSESAFAMDMDDEVSEYLHPNEPSIQRPQLSIVAYCIRILDMRDRILRYTRRVALQGPLPRDYLDNLEQFEIELHQFKERLPKTFEFSDKSLVLHAYSPIRKTIIMLKVWYQQCFIDLYRAFFPRLRESLGASALKSLPQTVLQSCRKICFKKAIELSEVFKLIQKLDSSDGFVVTDSSLAICSYQCARILLQASIIELDNSDLMHIELLENLNACAGVLTELRPVFVSVSRIQDDINAMIRNYLTSQERPGLQSQSHPGEVNTSTSSWNAINQERIMSKHGPFEVMYSNDMNEEGPAHKEILSLGNEEPIPPTSRIINMAGFSTHHQTQSQVTNALSSDIDTYGNNLVDWDLPFNDAYHDGLIDPFFRIQQDFGMNMVL